MGGGFNSQSFMGSRRDSQGSNTKQGRHSLKRLQLLDPHNARLFLTRDKEGSPLTSRWYTTRLILRMISHTGEEENGVSTPSWRGLKRYLSAACQVDPPGLHDTLLPGHKAGQRPRAAQAARLFYTCPLMMTYWYVVRLTNRALF